MFNNILVPLDGSKLAETALHPAESLSRTLGAPITLLHIIEKDAPQAVHSDHHLTQVGEAENYLKSIASEASSEGLTVNIHVHSIQEKDVAASIIQHATQEFNPDLIVMCAHGKGGIRDFVFGNIAQQVLSGVLTPLLLIQPAAAEKKLFSVRRILVPLDNESRHDEGLYYAMGLAKAYQAELYLLTVIPTYSTLAGHEAAVSNMLPTTSLAFLEIQEDNAKEHLQAHLLEIKNAGLEARAEIGRGDPAEVIASTATRVNADIILLSTHRKTGMEAFWARSVAPSVIRKTHTPMLLIPLKE